MTLQDNSTECNANAYCNATRWGCEPNCFRATDSNSCGSGCKWMTGWCNPLGMNDMFMGMESGAPVPLGTDPCGNEGVSQGSADICGFGMKPLQPIYQTQKSTLANTLSRYGEIRLLIDC